MLPFKEAWTGSLIHRRSDTLPDHRMARQAPGDPGRQRPRICQFHTDNLGREAGHRPDLHPARQATAERLRRAPQPDRPARMTGSLHLWNYRGGAADRRRMAIDQQQRRLIMGNGGVTPMKLKMAAWVLRSSPVYTGKITPYRAGVGLIMHRV